MDEDKIRTFDLENPELGIEQTKAAVQYYLSNSSSEHPRKYADIVQQAMKPRQ
jgi:hypothetical protein